MTIQSYIEDKKTLVTSYLQTYLKDTMLPRISSVGKWGNDAVTRILTFATRGKMLRSMLIYVSGELFTQEKHSDTLLKTSAAMELFQTGFLIHDDIMDNDETRRGMDSMHTQYQKILGADSINNSKKTGESFAMCSGDMSFFLGFQILAEIQPPDLSGKLNFLFSRELAAVCSAQMQDVYGGNTQKQFSQDEILSVYAYKTGRYSCGLPLAAGAMIAGVSDQTIKNLWKLGTSLGILFQIKDDELNLFGNPDKTGKPIGSDIRENKQTLYRLFLLKKARGAVKRNFLSLFGNPSLTPKDVDYVKEQVTKLHIEDDIRDIVNKQKQSINEIPEHVPIPEENRKLLREFVDYLCTRDA